MFFQLSGAGKRERFDLDPTADILSTFYSGTINLSIYYCSQLYCTRAKTLFVAEAVPHAHRVPAGYRRHLQGM